MRVFFRRRLSATCPPGSYLVCPPKQECYCDDFSLKGGSVSGLGLIPDIYFSDPLTALSTPGGPGPLGLTMVDTTNLRGCVGCGVPGMHAGPVAEAHLGRVMVDESPLGAISGGLAAVVLGLGAAAGVVAGYMALRRRRR